MCMDMDMDMCMDMCIKDECIVVGRGPADHVICGPVWNFCVNSGTALETHFPT